MDSRSLKFRHFSHNRYWWHRVHAADYIPIPCSILDDAEWGVMEAWFNDSEQKFESTGEANVPPLTLLMGLISGNAISRVVQCGHYVGYSTLLLGFLLRKMGKKQALFSIDIDASVTEYTAWWLSLAGLDEHASLSVADSTDPEGPKRAWEYFGHQLQQLVFIDSSHQYEHTLKNWTSGTTSNPRVAC